MSNGKIVLGVLAGFAAGAVLGILLAPDKGSDTRKKISKKRKYYADSIKNKFDEFKDSVSGKFENAKEDISEATEQA